MLTVIRSRLWALLKDLKVSRPADLPPEREKQGVLPGRPADDDIRAACDGSGDPGAGRSRRRPADIFVPRAIGGSAVAVDFACTSSLRGDRLHQAVSNSEAILADYVKISSASM